MKKAVRNLRLCTKDCLCLYVCPTGATDTEDSIIDLEKCIGCGACADACPSAAISMVPEEYPPQQEKKTEVRASLYKMVQSKADTEKAAEQLAEEDDKPTLRKLMKAVEKSERLIEEDLMREAGFMLAQSGNAHEVLEELIANPPTPDFPKQVAEELLEAIPVNDKKTTIEGEKKMAKWVCSVCGYVHEGDNPPEKCPICKQPKEVFKKVEEEKKSPYAGTKTEKNLWEAFAGESMARNKYTY
ncbi:MAG: 4Fe-4S binding protein, partial [Sphaerochaetaceae bacterium]|nr:4Fe-4S binding protein [Sphaerochaetaceae bacterium]